MHISKINEVHLKVETEPSIARELADYFTFEVPGHRFMPAYKNKIQTKQTTTKQTHHATNKKNYKSQTS